MTTEKHAAQWKATNEYHAGLLEHFTGQGLNAEEIRQAFTTHGTKPMHGVELELARRYAIAKYALSQSTNG